MISLINEELSYLKYIELHEFKRADHQHLKIPLVSIISSSSMTSVVNHHTAEHDNIGICRSSVADPEDAARNETQGGQTR